jgi:hypothetical protein
MVRKDTAMAPEPNPLRLLRIICIVGAALIAIGAPIAQYMGAFGLSAAEFSSSGDSTLRAAGYAFSIWGLIYVGLACYALYQGFVRNADPAFLARFGWPSVIAMTGCGLWLMAAGANWQWASVAIIVASTLSLLLPLSMGPVRAAFRDRLLILAPIALLAGWLTVASALNILTVLTAEEFISPSTANSWAAIGVVAVVVVALYLFIRVQTAFYLVPIVWGLGAVCAAEFTHRPFVAWLALGGGAFLAVSTLLHLWRSMRPIESAKSP